MKPVSKISIRPAGKVNAVVRVPGSKSITNRVLLMAVLAQGKTTISNALFSDDTHYMAQAIRTLGLSVQEFTEENKFVVTGTGGTIPVSRAELFIGNAGTAMRFLTAYLTLGKGYYEIDGDDRMRQRPIQDLLDGLCQLGALAKGKIRSGYPPVGISAKGLPGGRALLAGGLSSQYLSAILMAAPYAEHDVEIVLYGEPVSRPYVNMTIRLMEQFGVSVFKGSEREFLIKAHQRYTARDCRVEADASSASYFLAAAAITGGRVRVEGLPADSLQGDAVFADILARMGCKVTRSDNWVEVEGGGLRGIEINLRDYPDMAQTLAAVAVFAKGSTIIRGVANLRVKETDRIHALATELQRMGISTRELADGLEIEPGEPRPAAVETYNDHRMAMSLALVGLRAEGIRIKNPQCVSKTFPGFFEELAKLKG